MAVLNVHERTLAATPERVGALLETLSGTRDALWPRDTWPPLRLDPCLRDGGSGGHGPIRYTVSSHAPGRWIRFRFTVPRGFHGFHEFVVSPGPGSTSVLRHILVMRVRGAARVTWPLVWRWLHDAMLEDLLDRAENAASGVVQAPARWNAWVRLLRRGATLCGKGGRRVPRARGRAAVGPRAEVRSDGHSQRSGIT